MKWITYGKLSKDGHPHHPLFLKAGENKKSFDIEGYLKSYDK